MSDWAWHPTSIEELLLEAALGPAAATAATFGEWRARQPLDGVAEGSLRLLPLLMPRAALLPADDPALSVIRGTYRRAFFRGQLLAQCAANVLTAFHQRGIATMLLKGSALLAYYGGNVALRPMGDFDVLVAHRAAPEAIDTLLGLGYAPAFPNPRRLLSVYHGASFISPDGLDIDLHWQPLSSASPEDDEAALWSASVPTVLNGVTTRTPCRADLLAIVCAHATLWSPVSAVRWVADALFMLQSAPPPPFGIPANGAPGIGMSTDPTFEWQRVLESARRWHITLPLRNTLGYLGTRWHAAVPADLLRQLADSPVSVVDRLAYQTLGRQPGLREYLVRPWRRYRVRSRDSAPLAAVPGFIDYLKVTLGQRELRHLPGEAIRRVLRFRRARRLGRV